uniref:Putative non-specific serine/threonine protein kinase n=1 Tax=Ixodes ricinus TaxID=34613 RepID=A0A6B0VCS1_IXORI
MDLETLRVPELVHVCTELGIDLGQAKRKPHIIKLIRAAEISEEELLECVELKREKGFLEKDKEERESKGRARNLAQKRLELDALRQEVLSRRRKVVVEVTDSKYLAATFPHWFTYEGDPKPREKDLVSREERAVAPSGAITRQVAAETVGQKGKVEEEESDLTDDPRLSADGTTDAVPHNAVSKLEALEAGGDRDPAKEREEASQASDVCFLGDKDKASMVTPPQKSIQLKESSVERSADREAEQELGRPGRHPWNSEIKPGLDKRDQSQGCSEKASCSSRPSGKKEQKREQRRVCVLRPAPYDSAQQRQQRRDASSQKQKSSRPERGKRGGTHPKDPSAGGGCKSKGSKGSSERTRLGEKNAEQSPSETSFPSQDDIGGSSRPRRHRRRGRQRRSRRRRWVFRSGPNASDRDRRLGARNSRKSSSRPGESKRQDTYPKEPSIHSRNASNRPRGDTRKSTLEAKTARQSRSDENRSCEGSPSGRKSGVKPSHSSRASAARREDNRQNAGALLDSCTISTKYPVLGSPLKLRREIKSGAEIKFELSDCGFEKTVESGDQGFSCESGTENRLGVG